jgi:hypothetical protein
MKSADAARGFALGRVVVGAALLAAPRATGRLWVGEHVGSAGARVMMRGLGARDVALGVLTLRALRGRRPRPAARALLAASAFADAVDGSATLLEWADLPRGAAACSTAFAAGAAATGAGLSRAVGPARRPGMRRVGPRLSRTAGGRRPPRLWPVAA